MYQKFLNFLYYKNCFKLIVYTLKIISLFDKKYKKQISFYNFFKKRKIKYEKNILKNLYQPKIFIFQLSIRVLCIINVQVVQIVIKQYK